MNSSDKRTILLLLLLPLFAVVLAGRIPFHSVNGKLLSVLFLLLLGFPLFFRVIPWSTYLLYFLLFIPLLLTLYRYLSGLDYRSLFLLLLRLASILAIGFGIQRLVLLLPYRSFRVGFSLLFVMGLPLLAFIILLELPLAPLLLVAGLGGAVMFYLGKAGRL